jgi:hypothetical protein
MKRVPAGCRFQVPVSIRRIYIGFEVNFLPGPVEGGFDGGKIGGSVLQQGDTVAGSKAG